MNTVNKEFIADQQTLEDLNLLGRYKPASVFSIFNKVKTRGGGRWLEELFRHPLSSAAAINERSGLFAFFGQAAWELPFSAGLFESAETYLSTNASSGSLLARAAVVRKKLKASFLRDEAYAQLVEGLLSSLEVLGSVRSLIHRIDLPLVQEAKEMLADSRLAPFLQSSPASLSLLQVAALDHLLRGSLYEKMQSVLTTIYQLDVYIAVSTVAREKGFSYAKAHEGTDGPVFSTSALRHPALDKAVANPLALSAKRNLLFLTGANMAGKSTLMKSVGIALYLAHMGFPVAAGEMEFSPMDGLYCSINVADDLLQGYSHYYAEVRRVRQVAEQVAAGKRLLVIFDELFKGTNVRDAYEATLACTRAFARYSTCLFVISTHIIEVADDLKNVGNISFSYMPTVMHGRTPSYPYTLTRGVTEDRQGMVIIENEGILHLLK